MQLKLIALACVVGVTAACTNTSPFTQPAPFAASASHAGVDARWLDDLYQQEISRAQQPITDQASQHASAAAAPHTDTIHADSTLDDLLEYARTNHPAVLAAQARWAGAQHRITQQRTLPNPQISYEIMVDAIDRGQDSVSHSFGISQMFPWFGTLDQRAAVAHEQAAEARAQLIATQIHVIRNVKQAYAEYAHASLALSLLQDHHTLLKTVHDLAQVRFRAAEVTLADVLRAQQEMDRIDVDVRNTQDLIHAAGSRLNAALGRPADAPLPQARNLPMTTLASDVADSTETLLASNPQLRIQQRTIATWRQRISLAQHAFYPQFMVGLEYGVDASMHHDRGSDTLTAMIGIDLPIWRSSYEAGVREALAEFGASLKDFTDRHNALEADLKWNLYQLRDAQRRAELFGDVLRMRAEQTLQTTLTAYRAGQASFTDVIQVQRELLEFQLAHQRALADGYQALAEIEALLGQPVTHEQEENLP